MKSLPRINYHPSGYYEIIPTSGPHANQALALWMYRDVIGFNAPVPDGAEVDGPGAGVMFFKIKPQAQAAAMVYSIGHL